MLEQESSEVPFVEEEVAEAVLAPLGWRAEAKVTREVSAKGGIVADQVHESSHTHARGLSQ